MLLHVFLMGFFLVLLSPSASAQNTLGFRVGLNVAGVDGDLSDSAEFGTRAGLTVGLVGSIPLRYSLSFQPEVMYAEKGFTTEHAMHRDGMAEPVAARFELVYLEFPLLLAFTMPIGFNKSLGIYAGPTISVELAERVSIDELKGPQDVDQFKSLDPGVAFGSDFRVPLATWEIILGVRYTRSARNMLSDNVASPNEAHIFNEVVSFFIGLEL